MNLFDVAARFTDERKRIGYNQSAFARLLGLSVPGLRNIEAGESEFKVNVLMAAAAAGVDVQYVLTGVRSSNVKAVADEIGFEKQAIHGAVSGVGFAQTGANIQIIHTNNHRTTVKAETTPGEKHITVPQRAKLKELVDEVAEKEALLKKKPKAHRAIWAALNKHCQVNTYTLIALDDFEKARKYLHMWLGRLNSSASAPVKDGDAWRKSRYSYIKVNSKTPDDAEALKAYMARKYKAESLTELSNDELEEVYRYVAGRRNKKR
jgi:transcriptional regulator with XRE-family HTH domain